MSAYQMCKKNLNSLGLDFIKWPGSFTIVNKVIEIFFFKSSRLVVCGLTKKKHVFHETNC